MGVPLVLDVSWPAADGADGGAHSQRFDEGPHRI